MNSIMAKIIVSISDVDKMNPNSKTSAIAANMISCLGVFVIHRIKLVMSN